MTELFTGLAALLSALAAFGASIGVGKAILAAMETRTLDLQRGSQRITVLEATVAALHTRLLEETKARNASEDALQRKIADLVRQVDRLEAQLEARSRQVDRVTRERDEVRTRLMAVEGDRDQLRDRLEALLGYHESKCGDCPKRPPEETP